MNDEAEQRLQATVARIGPLDAAAMAAARARQDRLTKPPGALGRLEELSIWLAGVRGTALPRLNEKLIVTAAADHGVARRGVSAYPAEVTGQMVLNFLAGGAAVNVLARHAGARVLVVDAGVAALPSDDPRLLVRAPQRGTGDISRGPAMARAVAVSSLLNGAELAGAEAARGVDVIGIGDMGIGNTTPSAAITAVFSGLPPAAVTGRGTGIDDAALVAKVARIAEALAVNAPDPTDGIDVLAKVGGLEIGFLAGVCLGAAAARVPVMVDGFIATAAALVAAAVAPEVRSYLVAAHRSAEPGHDAALAQLGLRPLLDLQMRLGEGTGAALGIGLLEAAARILSEMATFDEAGVSDSDRASAGES
ncbi:MAG TPA: nicotinate-nucleotide--dimethylbenzimidazole phosphoribosyltransferase [Dehalococcoidia bacterium]|nr:nicotinate-nucleotide--dimethylbenzimidazole phosphoribosyltransferase [Dehalococcoidia bacterium]